MSDNDMFTRTKIVYTNCYNVMIHDDFCDFAKETDESRGAHHHTEMFSH